MKKVKLIKHDCLTISMLLYAMLYVMLAYSMLLYLMLLVCIWAIDFCKCFLFSCFVMVYCHIVCLFQVLICIMHSAFDLLVFPNSMFTSFFGFVFQMKGLCALWGNST